MPLLHCPKCCPKKWETVQGVAGSCAHSWDASDWREVPGEFVFIEGERTPRIEAVLPWGWRCDNCGNFKRPRPGRTAANRARRQAERDSIMATLPPL